MTASAAPIAFIRVSVAWSPAPRTVEERLLDLPAGSTVEQAIEAAGAGVPLAAPLGVWGRKAGRSQILADGDRVEIYRALVVDPKRARRERFSRQGARTAGLFAARRPDAESD